MKNIKETITTFLVSLFFSKKQAEQFAYAPVAVVEYQILLHSYDRVKSIDNYSSRLSSEEKKVKVKEIMQDAEKSCGASKSENILEALETFKSFCNCHYYLSY